MEAQWRGLIHKKFSIYLDGFRFAAAFVVFLSHFVYVRWTDSFLPSNLSNYIRNSGDDAVAAFFVLSGLVIAHTVKAKDNDWRGYAFSRATRIYLVVVPALVLTMMFDLAGRSLNPAAYDGWWFADNSVIVNFFRGLTFSHEFWSPPIRIGSNGPFWSLSYEIWYYALFGVAVFMRGWRRLLALVLGGLLVGPGIVLLAPVWIIGALLHWVLARDIRVNPDRNYPLIASIVLTVTPIVVYLICRDINFEAQLRGIINGFLGEEAAKQLRYASNFLWWWVLALIIASHLAGVFALIKRVPDRVFDVVGGPIRWFAMASFSLYLVHYPALQFLDAIMAGPKADPSRLIVMFTATLGICFIFAELFERRLGAFRYYLYSVFPDARTGAAAAE